MSDAPKLPDLSRFTGTEQWYRHPLNRSITYTDGAKYVADQVGAHWLLDEIALLNGHEKKVASAPFQVWKLNVKDSSAKLVCEDGNNNVVHTKKIPYTDFPEPGIDLWCTDNVILLPGEY